MREIPLTQGKVALVDDEDYEEVSRYGWYFFQRPGRRTGYALTNIGHGRGKRRVLKLHQLLMGRDSLARTVDHMNGDGLDNRRANLRWATRSQQRQNQAPRIDNRAGLKGVRTCPDGRWNAVIRIDGRSVHLGRFSTAEQAGHAYDAKARKVFGEFARTNFSSDVSDVSEGV